MGITTNAKDEDPGVPVASGAYCDQGSIRKPGNNVPDLEQCRNNPPTNTGAEADVSQNRIPGSSGEWDWRSDLQSQLQVNSALEVDGLSSINSSRRDVQAVSHSTYRCTSSSSILDSVHTAYRPFQTRETSGGFYSHTGSSFEIGSDRVHHPNEFSETSRSGSSMQHSLFANTEGRNNIQSAENDIISNILDFDPWDESLTMPPNFAKLLGQSDHRGSSLEQSNLLKQRNDQSRFSFARHEESNNQAYDNNNNNNTYSIYGQLSRGQPIQEFGVNRDIYHDKFRSQNGFASNHSGGYEQFTASPGFSSYKSPAVRSQVSAPPGFPAPSKLPPPGFLSHERANMSSDFVSGTRLHDSSSSVIRNAYHVPPPSSNLNTAGDIEFIDPAILAVGRGRIQNAMENGAEFDMRSGFYSQLNSFEKEARLHQLLAQRSQAAQQQQQVNVNNFTPSVSDHYFLLNKQWP